MGCEARQASYTRATCSMSSKLCANQVMSHGRAKNGSTWPGREHGDDGWARLLQDTRTQHTAHSLSLCLYLGLGEERRDLLVLRLDQREEHAQDGGDPREVAVHALAEVVEGAPLEQGEGAPPAAHRVDEDGRHVVVALAGGSGP